MTQEQEIELVERAKSDDGAFSELYDYYMPKIYGYIHKRVGDKDAAEDLTSQTFLKMVQHLPRFDTEGAGGRGVYFKSWLYRIATNTVIDYYRRNRPTEEIKEEMPLKDDAPNPGEQAASNEQRERVLATLSRMPEKYSKILHLKFFGDLSNEEIAAALGITPNNAGVLIYRALKSFEKCFAKF
ncbi:hypothetical protein COV82_06750 [Candidatus Peregrinibacteria bacterium CG11_big_fil_rev_8_21_14_0_20_46_8]|nr:MAG: hypothetical protein COV82_06750 [Candidatus Peregrinibacteria bacterium CG11_big_fil_rev_8_21_14_0_20_46_8]